MVTAAWVVGVLTAIIGVIGMIANGNRPAPGPNDGTARVVAIGTFLTAALAAAHYWLGW